MLRKNNMLPEIISPILSKKLKIFVSMSPKIERDTVLEATTRVKSKFTKKYTQYINAKSTCKRPHLDGECSGERNGMCFYCWYAVR